MQEEKYCYRYPHPAVTTDCVIFGYDKNGLQVLLVERGIEPFKGTWAFPGGFLHIDETAEEGALRELKEETGLEMTNIRQFHTFTAVSRDPRERVITIAYLALVRKSDVKAGDDAARAEWFPVDGLPTLAFDHKHIMKVAMKTLRQIIHFEPIGMELLSETFTMPELQKLYEAILGVKFDRRNFAKKMFHMNIVSKVDDDQFVVYEMEKRNPDCYCACCNEPPMMSIQSDDSLNSKESVHLEETMNPGLFDNVYELKQSGAPKGRRSQKLTFNLDKLKELKQNGSKLEF